MKIKKLLSNIYKYSVNSLFKKIYGEIHFYKNKRYSHNVKINFVKNKNIKHPYNQPYKVFKIKDGRISTDNVENVAIIDKNRIINDVSYQQIKGKLKSAQFNSALYKGTPYIQKKVYGKVLSLTQGASGHTNYFHWLYDILPKIKLYSEKYDPKLLNFLYIHQLKEYQKITLRLIGLDKIKILESDKYRHVSSNEIFAVNHPWYYRGKILDEAKKVPQWIIKWLKKDFLPQRKKFKANEKVFIDRSESRFNHCQIHNNEEVINFLENRGFTSYKVGELPFQKQIYLFNNAKIIIGAHGAAFANLAFCKPKTKIIEIKPIYNPNTVNKSISKINSLNYKLINTPKLSKDRRLNGDIILNLKTIKNNL
tara:strand:+ start:1514 stop:2611 length:1098 start_codon:yes stop_codon:yes gene_type:complete